MVKRCNTELLIKSKATQSKAKPNSLLVMKSDLAKYRGEDDDWLINKEGQFR
jgi:hypothetical protein